MDFKEKLQLLQTEIRRFSVSPHPITVICISKGVSIDKMQEAYDAGLRHFGESRLQEALEKQKKMPSDVIWHFIGPIQSNKARKIAEHFSFIHSLCSLNVAEIFSKVAQSLNKKISCFIQVNVASAMQQHGVSIENLPYFIYQVKSLPGIEIQGFMALAPHTLDAKEIRSSFHILSSIQKKWSYPYLSMGMSHDYPLALLEGSTHIRIGSYFFK